jgi:hypothetical protein
MAMANVVKRVSYETWVVVKKLEGGLLARASGNGVGYADAGEEEECSGDGFAEL